jgi:hypothetical protein
VPVGISDAHDANPADVIVGIDRRSLRHTGDTDMLRRRIDGEERDRKSEMSSTLFGSILPSEKAEHRSTGRRQANIGLRMMRGVSDPGDVGLVEAARIDLQSFGRYSVVYSGEGTTDDEADLRRDA